MYPPIDWIWMTADLDCRAESLNLEGISGKKVWLISNKAHLMLHPFQNGAAHLIIIWNGFNF